MIMKVDGEEDEDFNLCCWKNGEYGLAWNLKVLLFVIEYR